MKRTKVALLYGGRSVEHGVSVNSARNIAEYIDKKKFTIVPIGISQQGAWHLNDSVTRNIRGGKKLVANLDPKHPWLSDGKQRVKFDIVFPVLHGTDGEDGSIQGFLKSLSVPLVGTGVLGSALSMNKIVAKRLLREAGIPVSEFIPVRYDQPHHPTFEEVCKKLDLPFMVKAASLGSSVGVSKVNSKSDYVKAIKEAFRYDNELLIERYIKGREIECAILGNDPPKASLPGEIIISKKYAFYTFDAKYVDSKAVSIEVPAKLNNGEAEQIRELSVRAFQALKCEDYARVDLFLSDEGIFINEINTIPGFTNSSMYPMMWKERGISFSDLITRLIDIACKRHQAAGRIAYEFSSALNY